MLRKVFSLIGIMSLLCGLDISLTGSAGNICLESIINNFFKETGMPNELISTMGLECKRYIYENEIESISNEMPTFEGHSREMIAFGTSLINELSLGVYVFSSSGNYHIYPIFEWFTFNRLENDIFSFLLSKEWELVSATCKLNIWYKVHPENSWSFSHTMTSTSNISSDGYEIMFPRYTDAGYYIKGIAYFCAKPVAAPDKRICISYADNITRRGRYRRTSTLTGF